MRFRPVTQRMPAPWTTPGGEFVALPVQNTVSAVLFSPSAESDSESAESEGLPDPDSEAPPENELKLLQPRPGPPGGFVHGQGSTPPAPGKQNGTIAGSQSARSSQTP